MNTNMKIAAVIDFITWSVIGLTAAIYFDLACKFLGT